MKWFMGIFSVLFVGCGSNVDSWDEFVSLYAQEKCLVYKQCYRAHYEGEYGNHVACQEAVQKELQQNQQDYGTCSFVSSAANECLEAIQTSSCGSYWSDEASIYQTCREDIWTCSSD